MAKEGDNKILEMEGKKIPKKKEEKNKREEEGGGVMRALGVPEFLKEG